MNKLFLMLLCSLCLLSACRKSTQVVHTYETVEEKRVSGPQHAGVEQEKEDYR